MRLILETFAKVVPSFIQRVRLDGVEYTLAMEWNARDEAYYFSIDQAGEIILSGIRVVVGIDLLGQFKARAGCPQGSLYIHDVELGKNQERITPENIGERYLLIYEEADGI